MNQKVLRYVLIGGVCFIWGAILLKVFNALGQDKEVPQNMVLASQADFISPQKDSFVLLAAYPDPFLPEDAIYEADLSLTDSTEVKITVPANTPSPVETVDVSFIKYSGMIYNPEKKIKAAIVSFRGKDILLKENETAEDVTIKKITANKIIVFYKNKTMQINKSND